MCLLVSCPDSLDNIFLGHGGKYFKIVIKGILQDGPQAHKCLENWQQLQGIKKAF